jgi:endonuclease YncB( thermonuclease family)
MGNASVSRRIGNMLAWVFNAVLSIGVAVAPAGGAEAFSFDLSRHIAYPVMTVYDGDTIGIRHDSREVLVQVRGIEASRAGATQFLRGLLAGESVHIVYPTQGPRDWRGHLSAYLFRVRDHLFVNREILSQGYGIANSDAGAHGRLFSVVERQARAEERGLWSEEDLSTRQLPSAAAEEDRAKTIEHRKNRLASWRARNNGFEMALLEMDTAEQEGTSAVTVQNNRQAKVRVNFRGVFRTVSFTVPAGLSRSVSLINGQQYQVSFRFADEPSALYQGAPIRVDNNDPTITIGAQHDGNYPIRKIQ